MLQWTKGTKLVWLDPDTPLDQEPMHVNCLFFAYCTADNTEDIRIDLTIENMSDLNSEGIHHVKRCNLRTIEEVQAEEDLLLVS